MDGAAGAAAASQGPDFWTKHSGQATLGPMAFRRRFGGVSMAARREVRLSMGSANRPLSPHLQVYRPQFTSVLSTLHRMTGVWLGVGTLLLAYWMITDGAGAEADGPDQEIIGSWLGLLFLFGWSYTLFYHLCNGIRHLFWDAGYGFGLDEVYRSGWTVVAATGFLTLASWVFGYGLM